MKKYTCIGLICAAVLTMGACTNTDETENLLGQNQETKAVEYVTDSVTLTEAGTLEEHIGGNANTLEKLVISGPINATDVNVIRSLPRLEAIDMKEATIIGGVSTYTVIESGLYEYQYTLQNNTIGIKMLYGLPLSEIVLPENITGIGQEAFSNINGYSNLEIAIPEGVTTIGEGIFRNCNNLTSVQTPSTLKSIPQYTFRECKKLESVTLGENTTHLGYEAFYYCESLQQIKLPSNLTQIETGCFAGSGLINIDIPDNVVFDIQGERNGYIFIDCRELVSASLPEKSTFIPPMMFYRCNSLTSIEIPDNVTTICEYAFLECSSLQSIVIPDNVSEMEQGIFSGCTSLTDIKMSNNSSITNIPENTFSGCSALSTIKIPENIVNIGNAAFHSCSSLTDIIWQSNNIREIGNETFYGCTSLKNITIPASTRALGNSCFKQSGLTNIEIPSRVTSIGEECFAECLALTTITIPENITNIGEYIIRNSTRITSIFWETSHNVPSLFNNYENPNCLLYISHEDVNVEDPYIKNIIYNGIADEITLDSRAYGFDVPQAFLARSISYSMEFSSWTDPGWSSGWYTISLPFTVTDIRHEQGRILAPFNADVADAKPFWLRRLTENGFENVTSIEAGIPYIIAMPNNDAYLPEYNIQGWVTFSAQNESGITIPVTQSQILRDQGPRFALINNFDFIQIESETSDYYTLRDGSEFRRAGYTAIYPFTCYAIPNSATAATSLSIESAAPATRSAKPLGPIPSIDDM